MAMETTLEIVMRGIADDECWNVNNGEFKWFYVETDGESGKRIDALYRWN